MKNLCTSATAYAADSIKRYRTPQPMRRAARACSRSLGGVRESHRHTFNTKPIRRTVQFRWERCSEWTSLISTSSKPSAPPKIVCDKCARVRPVSVRVCVISSPVCARRVPFFRECAAPEESVREAAVQDYQCRSVARRQQIVTECETDPHKHP